MRHTYYITKNSIGHMGLIKWMDGGCVPIVNDNPWSGGLIIKTFRSRSDDAAIKVYKVYKKC